MQENWVDPLSSWHDHEKSSENRGDPQEFQAFTCIVHVNVTHRSIAHALHHITRQRALGII